MAFTVLNIITDEPIISGSELRFDYPAGKSRDLFLGASLHTLSFEGTFFRAPKDFTVIFAEEKIHVYWNAQRTIPPQRIVTIQLDEPLSGSHQDDRSGQVVPHLVRSQMFIVDLGRPSAPRQEHFASELSFAHQRKHAIAQDMPLSPMRNVTLTSHDNVAEGTVAMVRGLDLYNRLVSEAITLRDDGTAIGKKCFRHVVEVELSATTDAPISLGIGEALGFPMFMPGSGYVVKYFVNSRGLNGGKIIPGYEESLPTATTPDVRGSFTPPEDIPLNSENHLQLLVSLFNPSNIGLNEYADFTMSDAEKPPLALALDPVAALAAPLNQTPASAIGKAPAQATVHRPSAPAPKGDGPLLSLNLSTEI